MILLKAENVNEEVRKYNIRSLGACIEDDAIVQEW